ncbi:MAG: ImcF-related family protein [Pseudomonadota bacterium]
MTETAYHRETAAVRDVLDRLDGMKATSERALAEHVGQVLNDYATRLSGSDVPATSIRPARYALAVLLDTKIRNVSWIKLSAWLAAAHVHLFDRREVTVETLHQFADTAQDQGHDFADLELFLRDISAEIEGQRQTRTGFSRAPAVLFSLWLVVFLASLAGYAAFLDYRYHADVRRGFEAGLADLPAEKSPERLSAVARLYGEVRTVSEAGPLLRVLNRPIWTSVPEAEAVYRAEAAAVLPDALREAIGEALATEGDSLALYDTLRAWSILTGRSDWAPAFLAGWVEARSDTLGTGTLSAHIFYLDGPEPRLAVPDEELMAQARDFAIEATEAERAFLELLRLPDMRALGHWQPADHIAEIEDVFVLRSGQPLSQGVPHAFTRPGWTLATRDGVEQAIRTARIEAARLFPRPAATSFDSRNEVLERLQVTTLSVWTDWLEDLRVRPFTDARSAVNVSGALSRRASPLMQVIETVWREAGGDDPTRPVELKALIDAQFGAVITYAQSGAISQLSGLFATLNVALSAMADDDTRGIDALMGLQERARSVAALEEAPPLVAQIAEDVLAQTSATHARVLTNPLTREWQARVYPICQRAVDGRYPFHSGGDVDLASFDAFFGARGALTRFYQLYAERNLDTSGETWRWTTEARLSGVTSESAAFLQRAMTVAQIFYADGGAFGSRFDIASLAVRGNADVRLGGTRVAMRGDGQQLVWPGPNPMDGMQVTFAEGSANARVDVPGVWGFLRLMDQTNIRNRDEGRRQLVDLRVDGGRLFFELAFDTPFNPVATRSYIRGITCPPVL